MNRFLAGGSESSASDDSAEEEESDDSRPASPALIDDTVKVRTVELNGVQ